MAPSHENHLVPVKFLQKPVDAGDMSFLTPCKSLVQKLKDVCFGAQS